MQEAFFSSSVPIHLANIAILDIKVRRILVALKIQHTLPFLLLLEIVQIERIVVCRCTDIGTVVGSFTASASVTQGDGAVVVVSRVVGVECDAAATEILFVGYGLSGPYEYGCD
jgi:hypothetical protein